MGLPMIVGIVGSEAAKFTDGGRSRAVERIFDILRAPGVTEVVSGGCHLGGIDVWAAFVGKIMGLKITEFLPKEHSWNLGYKPRNEKIAKACDVLYCITVDKLPASYTGMRFDFCYHCGSTAHVKSGGCWTMKYATKLGRPTHLVVIEND
jgi:hypothetical protein